MNKLMVVLVAACAANAFAMPTKDELKKAQPLVAELMAPKTAEFKDAGAKDKAAAAAKVGDASVEFAKAAETEAAKFLFLKGAVSYYARGEQYDKAADAIATLQREVKDVPPAVIAEIAGKATGKISETKAPRLYAIYNSAKLQVKAGEEAKTLAAKLKKAKSDVFQRKYAEALAVSGNWKAAYAEFAKVSNLQLKAMAAAEAAGKAKNAEAGEFWWDYKPLMEEADDFFKAHAATFYSKALAAGDITGLKKNLVEQRVKQYGGELSAAPTVATAAKASSNAKASPAIAKKTTSGKGAWQEDGDKATLTLTNGEKLEFVKCPAGQLYMPTGRDINVPVEISRPYWIMTDFVTAAQAKLIHGARDDINQHFVHMDELGYELSFTHKRDLPAGYVVRLPTNVEYEYAYRADSRSWQNFDVCRTNHWGIIFHDGNEALMDIYDHTLITKKGEAWKGVILGYPELPPPFEKKDHLAWTTDPEPYHLVRKLGQYTRWDFAKIWRLPFRLVVGPDLVGEWKARSGKK